MDLSTADLICTELGAVEVVINGLPGMVYLSQPSRVADSAVDVFTEIMYDPAQLGFLAFGMTGVLGDKTFRVDQAVPAADGQLASARVTFNA